jgi:hypothetical protein
MGRFLSIKRCSGIEDRRHVEINYKIEKRCPGTGD